MWRKGSSVKILVFEVVKGKVEIKRIFAIRFATCLIRLKKGKMYIRQGTRIIRATLPDICF